jgi:hypothetical protein
MKRSKFAQEQNAYASRQGEAATPGPHRCYMMGSCEARMVVATLDRR